MAPDSRHPAGQHEEELRLLLAAIVESSSDVIISKDLNGTITSWNRTAELTFGYTAAEAIGRSITLIIPPDRQDEERNILEQIRRGEQISHFQTVRQRKDGSLLDVSVTISPIRTFDGRIVGASKVGRDISAQKQAEQALRDSEARYRQLAEQISDGIFRAGPDGRFLDANSAGLDMFGYTLDELTRLRIPDLLEPGELPKLADQFAALSSGQVVQNEWCFRRKDGSTFIGELSGRELPDGGYQSVLRDISERLRAEKERRTTMALLNTILASTPDLIWVKDLEGRFTLGNLSTFKFFGGAEPEKVPGRRINELLPWSETASHISANDRRVLDSGQPGTAEEEFAGMNPPVTLHTFRAALYDSNGRLTGLVGISRDISWQKRIEKELRESEERFRLLAEIGPHFLWIVSQNGGLEYANQQVQRHAGVPFSAPGDASQIEEMVTPSDREMFRGKLQGAYIHGDAFELEARLQLKDGTSRWYMIRGVPFSGSDSRTLRWCVTATDIEQQKHVQEELRRLNRDLEQFAHSASHDLREPLRTVTIFSELLRSRKRNQLDGEAQGYLEHLHTGATRMNELIGGLLSYVQSTRDGTPAVGLIDANICFQKALSNLTQAIAESRAEISCSALPEVSVAPVHLEQLFQNLLSNAIKYTQKNVPPRVEVSAAAQQTEWVFSVRDHGIGIAPEYCEQIFGLFKRLHGREDYPGTGIGLALCVRVVERYGGRIWVESEPGHGSTFHFTLPRPFKP